MSQFQINLTSEPTPDELDGISQGLEAYNALYTGRHDARRLVIAVRGADGNLLGGLSGWTWWDYLSVDLFWLDESLRGQGLGTKLLRMAEDEARSRGCKRAQLDTMSFQAPEFYKKHGYEVYAVLDGYAGKHQRIYMRKIL
jgi:ribosomal protein S18 acetylase RimI-like enzyme